MADVYQTVTDQIIAAIEAGAGSWRMPWHVKAGTGDPMPYNVTSRRHYRGVNTLQLWSVAQARGYQSHEWGTYKQWAERGAQVRKGEHGSLIVFWKFDRVAGKPAGDEGEAAERTRVMARGYSVFNSAQVDGYAAPPVVTVPEPERDAAAERLAKQWGGTVNKRGSDCTVWFDRNERFPTLSVHHGGRIKVVHSPDLSENALAALFTVLREEARAKVEA